MDPTTLDRRFADWGKTMDDPPNLPAPEAPALSATLPIPAVIAWGITLGIAGNVLLRGRGGPGLNVVLLIAGLGVAVWVLCRRAGVVPSREALALLGVGVAFAAAFVLRASEALWAFAFLATAVAFALPALHAGAAWLRRSGVIEQVEAVTWAGVNAGAGGLRLLGAMLAGRSALSARPAGSGTAVLRGLLLAVPFLLVFGALFMSADRMFSSLVTEVVDLDYEEILSHVFVTAVLSWLACGYLGGFLAGTRLASVGRSLGARPAVGIIEIGTALGLVNLLFLIFVSVQFRYLFGGGGLVEVTPGLTYAEYVREGYGHLALACALVLPSLLAADWLLERRHPRAVVVFRTLGGILLLLLLVIIASALERVRAYQAAYGLTESRFYGAAFVGWLTLLTFWFGATVLRGRRERFAYPALLSGFASVAVLLAVNPDAWIARTNLDRSAEAPAAAPSGDGVDVHYLASLSADAVPTLLEALAGLPPSSRCLLAQRLLERWGPDGRPQPDWRSWNWPVARARGKVARMAAELRGMVTGPAAEVGCPSAKS